MPKEDIWESNHYYNHKGDRVDLVETSTIFQCQEEDCEYVFTYFNKDAARTGKRMHYVFVHEEKAIDVAVADAIDNTDKHYRGFKSRVETLNQDSPQVIRLD